MSHVVTFVALLLLLLMLVPAAAWRQPEDDAVYHGFDPNLIYVDRKGTAANDDTVVLSRSTLKLTALPNSEPTVDLVTTPFKKLNLSFAVEILKGSGATSSLRLAVWSPETSTGYLVDFGPSPQNVVSAQLIRDGLAAQTLIGGSVIKRQVLGSYVPNKIYRFEIALDKQIGRLLVRVTSAGSRFEREQSRPSRVTYRTPPGKSLAGDETWQASVTAREAPSLFGSLRLTVTISSSSLGKGTQINQFLIKDYTLTVPHQKWQVSKINDSRVTIFLICLLILAGMVVAARLGSHIVDTVHQRFAKNNQSVSSRHKSSRVATTSTLLALMIVGAYLNVQLFGLGSHPFDITSEENYAYIGATYGPSELYFLPNTVTLVTWNGVPYHESVFPYQQGTAYLSTLIGVVYRQLSSGPRDLQINIKRLEFIIKAANVAFILADSLVIYAISLQVGITRGLSLLASGLFLFNPAVCLSASVWGQTHVISIFPILVAILLAERQKIVGAWVALGIAMLTRPQELVPAFVLGVIFLRKFPLRNNLPAIALSIALIELIISPFTLSISPSTPLDVLSNQLFVHEAGGNEHIWNIVSYDAYNVWTIVSRYAGGAYGLNRFHFDSGAALILGISYTRISELLVMLLVILACSMILMGKIDVKSSNYFALLAWVVTGFLVLKTGLAGTHFLMGLPFIILSQGALRKVNYFGVVGIWTITTFISMYASLGHSISQMPAWAQTLHQSHNVVTRLVMDLHGLDAFITLSALANIVVWVCFANIALSTRPSETTSREVA